MKAILPRHLLGIALACGLLAAPLAQAQTAAIYGSLGNFDVVNHTGEPAHGFEIQLEGLGANDVYYSFSYQRYGAPKIVPYATGVYVRWESTYNSGTQRFDSTTTPHVTGSAFGGTCYMGGVTYDTAGCEHFGVSLRANPTRTTYRWLLADAAVPGNLIARDPPSPIAGPVYVILPPPAAGADPILQVEVQAPEPAEAPELYGNAQWVKIFKTQLTREVGLDELLTGNAVVPQDPNQVEVSWDVIQAEPARLANGNGNHRRSRKRNQGSLKPDTRSVVRRYELYDFTGTYDPVTHEALCADLTCTAPADGELGDIISAQMTAANVQVHSLTINKTGTGTVSSADRILSCGSKCVASYNANSVVTLTATPGNSVFLGWMGACTGTALTCNVTVNGMTTVNASFAQAYLVSVKTAGGKGAIASAPAAINCGKTCSAAVAGGTVLTFAAAPEPGFRFVSWSGACSGTAPTCAVTVNSATTVQANFAK